MSEGNDAKSTRTCCAFSCLTLFIVVLMSVGLGVIWKFVNDYRHAKGSRELAQRYQERMDKLREVALSIHGYRNANGKYPDEIAQLVPSYIDVKKLFLDPENLLRRYPKLLGTPEEVREVVRNFGSYRLETRGALYLIEIGFDRQPSNLRINLETSKVSSGPWEYGEED